MKHFPRLGLLPAAALALLAMFSSPAFAATGLAVICPDATQEGLRVPESCKVPQGYKTPSGDDLVRVDPSAVDGAAADWGAANLDYVWMKWSAAPNGMLYETCKTDIPDPTAAGSPACTSWGFARKGGSLPYNSVFISWVAPTKNEDGTDLTTLTGFYLYSGLVNPPATKSPLYPVGTLSTVFNSLAAGTWYFQLTAVNAAGIESAKSALQTKIVASPANKPTVTMSVTPKDGVASVTPTISWGSTGATSCVASGGWTGTKLTSGSALQAKVTKNTTFTLSCTGAGGTTVISADVIVSPRPAAPTITVR